MLPTAHIDARSPDEIAKKILLPGDPLRAKYIAENFLSDVQVFNRCRNMLGYTGTYQGQAVSVMGTGMGMPSIALYTYELIHFYGVKSLIRIGSCGALQAQLKLNDIVLAMSASYDSAYPQQFQIPGTLAPTASYSLLNKAAEIAKRSSTNYHVGNILSSDIFYADTPDSFLAWKKMGVLAVEMEAAALYLNAARAQVDALCLLTVSDSLITGEKMSSEQREKGFSEMVSLALQL